MNHDIIHVKYFIITVLFRHVMKKALDELGFHTTLVLDASVGYIMSQVDYVLMGAEGVVESGGIINKVRKEIYSVFKILNSISKSCVRNTSLMTEQ